MPQEFFKYIEDTKRLTLLADGGSERNFYRVEVGDNRTLIYMNYSDEKEENKFYCDIALFLKSLNINVPQIYYKEDGNVFLEDLGNTHLYNLVINNPEADIIGYYYKVIDQLLKLHLNGESQYKKAPFKISNGFDYSLYRWESKYFLDNLIKGYFNIVIDVDIEPDFHFLAETLAKEGNVLIHRDCQSKNIMIKEGIPYFIDFQGLRYGLAQYDMASLLEDPYVDLGEKAKIDLLNYYGQGRSSANFLEIYNYCAIQRLMQALGAYVFLGLKKGKREFLQYIPNGIRKLKLALENQEGLNGLKKLLSNTPRLV